MKKTQVALAALALVASTAALADVAVYGTLDAGIASSSGSTVFYGDGNNATTHFGLKGSEDLGNGLKAGFNLQSGIDVKNGASGVSGGGNTGLFNRGASISLGNENLGLTVGNQFSNAVLYAGFVTGGNAVGGDGVNVPGVVRLLGGKPGAFDATGAAGSVFFIPGAVTVSFNAAGFSGDVMTRVVSKDANNSSYTGATLRTEVAGVNLALGYQTAGYTVGTKDYTSTYLAANTKLGDIRVNGAFSSNTGAAKSNAYMLGASMPLVGALSGGISYANGTDAQGSLTGLSLEYALSKSTMAYLTTVSASKTGQSMANAALTVTGKSLTTIGLRHSF